VIKTERTALILSAAMSLMMGTLGMTFAWLTNSQAILLDGLFNLIYVIIALVTIRVASLAAMPDTEKYPYGYAYFESLVNAGKGLLILGVSLLALGDSLLALFSGGREVAAGLAIAYALAATLICSLTALTLRQAYRHAPGPLLRADVENWIINSLISSAVLAAFCLIPLMQYMEWHQSARYVDPILVTAVVVFCLGVPVRMASVSIKELLNRAPPRFIREPVRAAVAESLSGLPVKDHYIRMVRPGRTLYVAVYVVLPEDFPVDGLASLDAIRQTVDDRIRQVSTRLVLDVLFTADPRWASPTAGYDPRAMGVT